jgi:copper chaperone CopZ
MKKISLLLLTLLTVLVTVSYAKEPATKTSFKVWGNCDQCKKRIEKAAKTDGVKSAVWNEDTKVITVTFNPGKISLDDIQKNIAKAGYDTEKFKAEETDYKNLPKCCQYDRKN